MMMRSTVAGCVWTVVMGFVAGGVLEKGPAYCRVRLHRPPSQVRTTPTSDRPPWEKSGDELCF